MNDDTKRKLENQLMVMGLNRLTDPHLIPQMARLIRDDDFFLGMLNECDVEKRREMYDALRPYLPFTPKPLDYYINKLKEKAAAIASWAEPVVVGKEKYQQVAPTDATGVVITMSCSMCPRDTDYYGETILSAVILARQDGWARDRATQKEVCPKCECADRPKRKECFVCRRRHFPPSCRMTAQKDADATQMAESMIKLTDA